MTTTPDIEAIRKRAETRRGFRRGIDHTTDNYLDMLEVFDALAAERQRADEAEGRVMAAVCYMNADDRERHAELTTLRARVSELEEALALYGDPIRMATAPAHLQQAIDAAISASLKGAGQ